MLPRAEATERSRRRLDDDDQSQINENSRHFIPVLQRSNKRKRRENECVSILDEQSGLTRERETSDHDDNLRVSVRVCVYSCPAVAYTNAMHTQCTRHRGRGDEHF